MFNSNNNAITTLALPVITTDSTIKVNNTNLFPIAPFIITITQYSGGSMIKQEILTRILITQFGSEKISDTISFL